jgi:hypothetical protein
MRKKHFIIQVVGIMLGIWWGLGTSVSHAIPISVSLHTSPISGGSFSIVLDLIDGDATSNTSVTISSFMFGGGSPSGSPILIGGASGSLSAAVTLTDTSFFNEFVEGFTAGSMLSFILDISTNFAGGTPDSFAFLLLDSNGDPVPTDDPLGTDALLAVDLVSPLVIQTFSSPQFDIPAPDVQRIPEPATLILFSAGLAGLVGYGYGKRRAAA